MKEEQPVSVCISVSCDCLPVCLKAYCMKQVKSRGNRLTSWLTCCGGRQVTGIDGNYRMTCESVLEVLRDHRDSVMAVLEAFVYDPLLNWRLMDGKCHLLLDTVIYLSIYLSTFLRKVCRTDSFDSMSSVIKGVRQFIPLMPYCRTSDPEFYPFLFRTADSVLAVDYA